MNTQSEALRLADAIQLAWLENVDADKADIDMIQTELRRLHEEVQEQCRINGMGAEREARLMAVNQELVKALKLGLEALEQHGCPWIRHEEPYNEAIIAIRKALEQPAQKRPQNCGTGYCSCIECLFEPKQSATPIAYAVYHRMGGSKTLHWPEQHSDDGDHNEYQLVPLYASPQPAQPSKPLTDEQITTAMMRVEEQGRGYFLRLARAIEAAHGIKENA